MARSLDEILKEIDAGYNPQRQSIQTRLDALPAQADAEIAGLRGEQDRAFQDILGGARDRGMGFSGVPIAEQSRYTASQFLPAVARVRQSQNESRQSLFDALNNVNLQRNQFGQQIFQTEQDRAEQARQFNAQQAAARRASTQQSAVYSGLFGNQGGQVQGVRQTAAVPEQQQRDYNFVKSLIEQVRGGDGTLTSTIISQARQGNQRSKEIMRAFYELQGRPIPANFRSFL